MKHIRVFLITYKTRKGHPKWRIVNCLMMKRNMLIKIDVKECLHGSTTPKRTQSKKHRLKGKIKKTLLSFLIKRSLLYMLAKRRRKLRGIKGPTVLTLNQLKETKEKREELNKSRNLRKSFK